MTYIRSRILGVLLVAAAIVIILVAYWNRPSSSTCNAINSLNARS